MGKNNTEFPEVIEAAGGLLWRGTADKPEIAIVHRPRYNDWTLPKGKREPGETWQETALREVLEETGCRAEIQGFAGGLIYTVSGTPKIVMFWQMKLLGEEEFTPNDEVDVFTWLSPEEARRRMTYEGEINLIPATLDFL